MLASYRGKSFLLWILLGTCITGLFLAALELRFLEGKHPAKMTIQQKTIRGVDDTLVEIDDHYDYDETGEEASAADAAASLSETKNLPPLVPSEDTAWCPKALLDAGALTQSSSHVWTNLQDKILNATYIAHPHMELMNATVLHDYKEWIDQLFSYYTNSKLRRSVMNAAPPKQIVELLKLAEEIKRSNAQIDKDESSSNEEDGKAARRHLRILILGGSVTSGVGCRWPEVSGIKRHSFWATPGEKCAWPYRLEPLLNHVLFGGEDVVKVDNLSTGGQTSESGTMLLDYRLFPDPDYLPDVVIPAYSANESREGDLDRVLYYLMQNFVEAAQHLHPCNDQKPLIMNVDDFYGLPFGALRQTAKIFMISKWNNIMAVDYASTVKYKLQAEVHENNSEVLPILHSNYELHSGIGMHTGIAWTVSFNMVNSIVNVCNDRQIEVESHTLPKSSEESVDSSSGNSKKDYDGNNATDNSSGSIVDATVSSEKRAASTGNLVNPDLAANLQIEEPPFQHFGRIDETLGDVNKIQHDLQHNINATREFCKTKSSETNDKEEPKCAHAWFVSVLTGFNSRVVLDNVMNSVLIAKEGWAAEGYPVRQPRIGWNAHTANATFSIKLENVTVDTKFISVLSMKSYSEKWKNSKLAISTTVVQNSTVPMDMETNRTSKVDWRNEDLSYIDGYHEIKTSVFFLHKFPIVEGARKGDSVIVDMKLVQGSEFKITSIALCSS